MKKRKIMAVLMTCSFLTVTGCGAANQTETTNADVQEAVTEEDVALETVTIPAADATLEGVTLKDTPAEAEIYYSQDDSCILGLGEFSTATYNTGDIAPGTYDVYLNISKGSSAFICGSTPITISVNDGKVLIPSLSIMPCAMEQMGVESAPTYQQDMGLFLLEAEVDLDGNDTITIGGVPGFEFEYNDMFTSAMPAIGDMVLYPAGTEVEQGYQGNTFKVSSETVDSSDPLSGLNIAWLGSSVTYGQGADGYSMADEIANKHAATTSYKYAISATTLADYAKENALPTDGDGSHGSYVSRLKQLDTNQPYDLFIIQLSTNDATGGIPMGEISDSKDINDQDTKTVIGAMEYIIAYVQENWGCPVMFYTGTQYDSEQYADMVDSLLQIADKWDIGVIDLWNNEELNSIDAETSAKYIKEDGIHPLRDGYVEWWTPAFEEAITEYLQEK